MRQLGARLPEPPPAETDVETASNVPPATPPDTPAEVARVEPYPVEVHRIAPRTVDSSPADSSSVESSPQEPAPAPEPVHQETRWETRRKETPRAQETHGPGAMPAGRWAEFHEFRRLEPGRGSRLSLEAAPGQEAPSWDLRPPRREREHHSPFLTLAVPGITAILAVGALLWSGSLRDRVHQQDAAMGALQEQNQKLADTLAQMSVEQKASSALNANADSPNSPAANAANGPASGQPQTAPPATPPNSPGTPASTPDGQSAQPGQAESQPASEGGASSGPVQKERARQPEKRQGVSTPPPVGQPGRSSAQQSGSRYRPPVQTGYAPEIVPPYPTLFKAENAAADAASSQAVPNAGAYHPPSPAASPPTATGSASARAPQTTAKTAQSTQSYVQPSAPQPSVPQPGATRPAAATPGVNRGAPASNFAPPAGSYGAAGDGSYSSALAENIEAVEGLQRHSPVPLHEFHVYEGRLTKLTPALGLSVRRPDQGNGTYALVLDENGKHYQLPGQVNSPLIFTDNTTHREYALVVLHIADRQVYGYVRPMQ
jgi:hypothetical protein